MAASAASSAAYRTNDQVWSPTTRSSPRAVATRCSVHHQTTPTSAVTSHAPAATRVVRRRNRRTPGPAGHTNPMRRLVTTIDSNAIAEAFQGSGRSAGGSRSRSVERS